MIHLYEKSPYVLIFEYPGLLKTQNQLNRLHYQARGRLKNKLYTDLNALIGPRRPASPLKSARLTLIRKSERQPDYDGLVGSWKGLIDSLKYLGILWDDGPSVIEEPSYSWKKAPRNKGSSYVEIREIVEKP